jgi:CBS-domain-containing membrane protein
VPVAAPGELLVDLLPRLSGCSDGRVLALQDGRLVGIISPSDIARTLDLAALHHPRAGLRPGTFDEAAGS